MNFISDFFSHWERAVLAGTLVVSAYFFFNYAKAVFFEKVIQPFLKGFSHYWGAIKSVVAQEQSLRYTEMQDDFQSLIDHVERFNKKWVNDKHQLISIMGGLPLNSARSLKDTIILYAGEFNMKANCVSELAIFAETSFSQGVISDNVMESLKKIQDPYKTQSAAKTVPVEVIKTVQNPPQQQYQQQYNPNQKIQPGWTATGETQYMIQNRIRASAPNVQWEIALFDYNPSTQTYDIFNYFIYITKATAESVFNAQTVTLPEPNGSKTYGYNFTGNSK